MIASFLLAFTFKVLPLSTSNNFETVSSPVIESFPFPLIINDSIDNLPVKLISLFSSTLNLYPVLSE